MRNSPIRAVDLFAGGARGWDLHDAELGIESIGIESDPTACATSRAAGYATREADVRTISPRLDRQWRHLLKGSPPCQAFSKQGKSNGRLALESIYGGVRRLVRTGQLDYTRFADPRAGLILEPLRWALEARRTGHMYQWITLEQVPPALPIWEYVGQALEKIGYNVAAGVLSAEQYGVPQVRPRAILVAALGSPTRLPEATHSKWYPKDPGRRDPGLKPWVPMADVITPYPDGRAWLQRSPYSKPGLPGQTAKKRGLGLRRMDQPALTVTSKRFHFVPSTDLAARRIATTGEAAALQSLAPGHPWQGGREQQYLQIGNAIPGLLAKAILESVL